jgi:hypothetical protein
LKIKISYDAVIRHQIRRGLTIQMQTLYSDLKMRDKSRSRILSTAGRPALDIALRLIELCYGCRLFWRELPAWYLVSARAPRSPHNLHAPNPLALRRRSQPRQQQPDYKAKALDAQGSQAQ